MPLLVLLIVLYGVLTDWPIHLAHSGFSGLLAYYSISITCRVISPSLFRISNGRRHPAAFYIGLLSYSCGLLVSLWVHVRWDF